MTQHEQTRTLIDYAADKSDPFWANVHGIISRVYAAIKCRRCNEPEYDEGTHRIRNLSSEMLCDECTALKVAYPTQGLTIAQNVAVPVKSVLAKDKLCKSGKHCFNAGKYNKPAPAQTRTGFCNKNCAASDRARQNELRQRSNHVKTTESSILIQ